MVVLPKVAVIGGGITGAVVASEISQIAEVTLYDQGRRGPGGRASHRSVDPDTHQVLPDDVVVKTKNSSNDGSGAKNYEFDHGCQFFRADNPKMSRMVKEWIRHGWAAQWRGRFGCLPSSSADDSIVDFFGLPSRTEPVYIGVGGMHQVPRKILTHSKVKVHRGTRVSCVEERLQINDGGNNKWEIFGLSGNAAFHDTPENEAQKESNKQLLLQVADLVIFTDVSSAMDSWHRASANIPAEFRKQLIQRQPPRIPLFTCMVALDKPIRKFLPYDAFTCKDPELWFAACSSSKIGMSPTNKEEGEECWTLVSTPGFACMEIEETAMQDPKTGAFRPQENQYLNRIPGPKLFDAFLKTIRSKLTVSDGGDDSLSSSLPTAKYLQAQRWGSGLPAPRHVPPNHITTISGVRYANKLDCLVYDRPVEEATDSSDVKDFIADDFLGLYYAGDYCSYRSPSFEAAALSGLDLAEHIKNILSQKSNK